MDGYSLFAAHGQSLAALTLTFVSTVAELRDLESSLDRLCGALLEFYFRCDSDVRSGIGPLGLIGAKEIKIPFDCNPCARNQFEVFNAGITYLHSRAVLTVLNNGVVQIQFVLSV